MRFQWFLCLFLAGVAYGQKAPAPTPAADTKAEQAAPAQAPARTVAPEETVLTVKGVCADSSKQDEDCKTAITRAQFEKLAEALQPNMSAPIRRQLASSYGRMLLMAAVAEKRGLDKQPKFDEMLRFARMQILSLELTRTLQNEAGKLSDSDIDAYYQKNAANFEQADLLRIYVPHSKQILNSKPDVKDADLETQRKAGDEEMNNFAIALHARAAHGEDFDKLEKEAFTAAGFKGSSPEPKMTKVRRTTLPPNHGVVLDLKPGEVSELISDASGYYIYKMVSKQKMPLDSVKEEIRSAVSGQRYRDAMQGFQRADNTELNEAYFGAMPKPAVPVTPRGSKAPQEGEEDRN